ncbi:DUF397 domain-containing protein [Embleya sp. AB8]|uniref:DUF397 domain-containing protein n=1 Tax=Embleya sp. AB8 TaxID=3156304 RepID=UPI003C706F43
MNQEASAVGGFLPLPVAVRVKGMIPRHGWPVLGGKLQRGLSADDHGKIGRPVNLDNHAWRKSRYSNGDASCVEVAPLPASTGVRDTKDRGRGHLQVSLAAWGELVSTLKR